MSQETRLTERQFFTLSLAGLTVLMLGIYFGLLRPQFRKRAEMRREVEQMTRRLQTSGFLLGEAPLLRKKRTIEQDYNQLLAEWETVSRELATFENQAQWRTVDVAKIDYKFYLYITRDQLRKKARAQKINVPALLGLPDEIMSNDVAREKMLQLRAVETLVDTAIEYGIADIRSIDPLPPVVHSVGDPATPYLEEYPLKIIFEGDMRGLYRLWEAMFQPGQAMLLRNVAMEKTSLRKPDEVRMTATLSSFLFLREAEKIAPETRRGTRARAIGH